MGIKVLTGNNASDSGMVLGSQKSKGLMDPENMQPRSASDIKRERRAERIMQEIMSKPQRGTKLFDMAGIIKEPFSEENTLPSSASDIERAERAEHIMQEIMSRPQNGTKFLQLIGIVEERISPDNS